MMQGRQGSERGRNQGEGREKRWRPPGNGRVPRKSWWPVQSYDPCLSEGNGQGTWEVNPGNPSLLPLIHWDSCAGDDHERQH